MDDLDAFINNYNKGNSVGDNVNVNFKKDKFTYNPDIPDIPDIPDDSDVKDILEEHINLKNDNAEYMVNENNDTKPKKVSFKEPLNEYQEYPDYYQPQNVIIIKNSFEIMCESIVNILKDILSGNLSFDLFTKEDRLTGILYFFILCLVIFLILSNNDKIRPPVMSL